MNRLTKQYKDTKRYYSTHTCDEILQKLGKLEDIEEVLEEYNVTLSNLREVLLVGQMFISKPTLEEVKKEWEDDGWKWKEGTIYIELIKNNEDYNIEISIDKIDKTYCCFEDDDCDQTSLRMTLQEHIRLTKTFRALGWEV